MSDIWDRIEQVDKEQLHSVPAKRLIEKLSLIKNRVDYAKKRWFWELLQNASDYNESVSVKLVVNKDEVIFSHNGGPFSIKDVFNLIRPDSTKTEDTVHEDNIGKFGTGFVATHILSSIVKLEGICKEDEKHYRFSCILDRSMYKDDLTNREPLIEAMEKAKKDFKDSFAQVELSEGFHTSFTYQLGKTLASLPAVSSNDIELEYLYDMLPYTLCFMPKVDSVTIEDNRNGKRTFSISRQSVEDQHISFNIVRDSETTVKDFVYISHNKVSTAFQISDNSVVAYPDGMSRLFCGLPLIGTEETGLPIILNSLNFQPSIERDSVEIQPSVDAANRELFNDSIILYNKVLECVEKKELHNAFVLARLRKKYIGTQISSTQFITIYIPKYKDCLLRHKIVENIDGEFILFSQMYLPFNESKTDTELFENARFLFSDRLPLNYKEWFDMLDFSIFTAQKYTYSMLADAIDQKESIYSFSKDPYSVKDWLLGCLAYLKKASRYIFNEKRLLPNQKGVLRFSNDLSHDADLPVELKNIYKQLNTKEDNDIETELLDKTFDVIDVLNRQCCVEDLAKRIDAKLKELFTKNNGSVAEITTPINALYEWMGKSGINDEELRRWFHWYYPKRASLIVDLLTERERAEALVIAKSGKMTELATLATLDITQEEWAMLISNFKKLPLAISLLSDKTDDKSYANSEEGDDGERIVYKDLLQKFPRTKGYTIVWASRDRNEPRFDFEVLKGDKKICYCDAKTTMRGIDNADSIPFFMRKSQWEFLQTLSDEPYYIARVFRGDGDKIRYINLKKAQFLV